MQQQNEKIRTALVLRRELQHPVLFAFEGNGRAIWQPLAFIVLAFGVFFLSNLSLLFVLVGLLFLAIAGISILWSIGMWRCTELIVTQTHVVYSTRNRPLWVRIGRFYLSKRIRTEIPFNLISDIVHTEEWYEQALDHSGDITFFTSRGEVKVLNIRKVSEIEDLIHTQMEAKPDLTQIAMLQALQEMNARQKDANDSEEIKKRVEEISLLSSQGKTAEATAAIERLANDFPFEA